MTRHDAKAVRGQYGDASLWRAVCSTCRWRAEARSKQDAERLAKVHSWAVPAERRLLNALAKLDEKMPRCQCGFEGYDPQSMEYAPDQSPCLRCALLAEFGVIEEGAA